MTRVCFRSVSFTLKTNAHQRGCAQVLTRFFCSLRRLVLLVQFSAVTILESCVRFVLKNFTEKPPQAEAQVNLASYRLAFDDIDYLLAGEQRPLRLLLELGKPETELNCQ